MVIFGFIANRLNVERSPVCEAAVRDPLTFPDGAEIAVTLSIVALGIRDFPLIARFYPVCQAHSIEIAAEEMKDKEEDAITVA